MAIKFSGWIEAADGPAAWWLTVVQVEPPLPGITYPLESDSPHIVHPSVPRPTFRSKYARIGAPVVVTVTDDKRIKGRMNFKYRQSPT